MELGWGRRKSNQTARCCQSRVIQNGVPRRLGQLHAGHVPLGVDGDRHDRAPLEAGPLCRPRIAVFTVDIAGDGLQVTSEGTTAINMGLLTKVAASRLGRSYPA